MQHIVALSFEHRIGNQVDGIYPPLPDKEYVKQWNQGLPFIGIPDKAHGSCSSTIHFTLPNPDLKTGHSYGIAAYRSIDASELKQDPAYVRNQVQRSLLVISSIPLYGELEQKLKTLLYDNFDNLVPSLEKMYNELLPLVENPVQYSGISYPSLFQNLQTEVLTAVKALFLGHRILIFADNSELVSKMVTAIGSLLPGFTYNEDYPYKFFGNDYAFAPYVPLQFTEVLNQSKCHSKLMGTCSELFMDQKIVDYDILIDCRKIPALITGEQTLKFCRLTAVETRWMESLLNHMKVNWQKPDNPAWVRKMFTKWSNTFFSSLLATRHLDQVPEYIWPYLDWQKSYDVFGELFVKSMLKKSATKEILRKKQKEAFAEKDNSLVPPKKFTTKALKFW